MCGGAAVISLLLNETIDGGTVAAIFYWNGLLTWNRPIWFLVVLFEATVLTNILIKNNKVYYLSILGSFTVGYLLQNTNFSFGLSILPVAYCWVGIGVLSKRFLTQIFDCGKKQMLLILVISLTFNYLFSYVLNTRISVIGSFYGNYFYAYAAGFFGICMYWNLSKLIGENKIFELLGRHGVLLLSTQYFIFRIISYISLQLIDYDCWREKGIVKAIILTASLVCFYSEICALIERKHRKET